MHTQLFSPCLLYCLIALHYGYVPHKFGGGIIIPLAKDKDGDLSCSSNYQSVTLSTNIAKLFEMCLLELYSTYLHSSAGCNSAIYTVKSVVEYYTKHSSAVNVCLLDMSKAFDKVNHYGLHLKLMKRNIS